MLKKNSEQFLLAHKQFIEYEFGLRYCYYLKNRHINFISLHLDSFFIQSTFTRQHSLIQVNLMPKLEKLLLGEHILNHIRLLIKQ